MVWAVERSGVWVETLAVWRTHVFLLLVEFGWGARSIVVWRVVWSFVIFWIFRSMRMIVMVGWRMRWFIVAWAVVREIMFWVMWRRTLVFWTMARELWTVWRSAVMGRTMRRTVMRVRWRRITADWQWSVSKVWLLVWITWMCTITVLWWTTCVVALWSVMEGLLGPFLVWRFGVPMSLSIKFFIATDLAV
jgi:hypothetical protein